MVFGLRSKEDRLLWLQVGFYNEVASSLSMVIPHAVESLPKAVDGLPPCITFFGDLIAI